MRLIDELRGAAERLPVAIVDGLDRHLRAMHRPELVDESTPWCFLCRRPWPCAEFVAVDERMRRRAELPTDGG